MLAVWVAATTAPSLLSDSFGFTRVPLGTAQVRDLTLSNNSGSLSLSETGAAVYFFPRLDYQDAPSYSGTPFALILRDGRTITPASMKKVHLGVVKTKGGRALGGEWSDDSTGLKVQVKFILRDNTHYVREELTVQAASKDVDIAEIALIEGSANATVLGTAPGSPLVSSYFLGLEHPMAKSISKDGHVRSSIERKIPIVKGGSVAYSAVYGAVPAGQLRRAFLAYIENERPRGYKPFLHYNSWYDLGYFTKFTADQCVERITTYGKELAENRGVKLSSFLFDDGWDDTSTVWQFHNGFPNGFLPLKAAAEKFGADPGIWLSPWGGYGGPRQQRLTTGKKLGYEIDNQGYALSGPKYYSRFHEVTLDLVKKYGINQFKLDGTGSPDKQYPGSAFASDFDAAISLIGDLRKAKPGLFINLTTGTWPSPFWTRYADSIWRGGSDHSFAGVGPDREKWVTYRDSDTFRGVVQKGPLYPLNSLMLHGMIYAQHAHQLDKDPAGSFRNEVRSYFATGTQLQEMYITPSLLTKQNWDDLAESAKWSAENAGTLRDVHWVGGDPGAGEVYGWAAWSPKKAILTLRNPSDKPQAFSVELGKALELPFVSIGTATLHSPYSDEKEVSHTFPLSGHKVIELKPFQVLTLEGTIPADPQTSSVRPEKPWPTEIGKASDTIKVACVGDSITQGVGVENVARDSYPSQLQRMLGSKFEVVNAGNSGSTLLRDGWHVYWQQPEFKKAIASNPNAVVIMLGTNDAHTTNWSKNHDLFVPTAQELIRTFRELPTHPFVYVCLPVPAFTKGDGRQENVDKDIIPLWRQAVRGIPGVKLIDLRTPLDGRRDLFPDDLHPNVAGAGVMAENVYDALTEGSGDHAGWKLVSFDSEEAEEGTAAMAIDGDPDTYWHTAYSPKNAPLPHELVVDTGKSQKIGGFRYLPRQDGGVNGRIKAYEFYVSEDGKEWGAPVAKGEFKNTAEASRIRFAIPVTGRYFRFVAKSEANGGPWTTIAEFDILPPRP